MNLRAIAYYLGYILRLEAILMLPPLAIAVYRGESSSVDAFIVAIFFALLVSLVTFLYRRADHSMTHKEGFVIVSLCWIVMSVIGCIPFFFSGYIPNFLDAFFEIVAGFTTTGATILSDVECLPYSLLYWRSFTNWVGGMGILVFALTIIPMSKGKGDSMHVLRSELPGPTVGKMATTMRNSARVLYGIYIILTLILILLLYLGGMPLFDSVVNAFATAGTGGFSIKNASIGAYDSYYLQLVISVFMVLFGINFNLYYFILMGKARQALKSEELRVYLGLIFFCTLTIAINLSGMYPSALEALHHSFFQVSAILSTTCFFVTDYNLWPEYSRNLLVMLMVIGGCAGSTGGGVKVARIMLLWKSLRSNIQKLLFPRSVKVIKMEGKPVDDETIQNTLNYMVLYSLIAVIAMLLLAMFDDLNLEVTLSVVLAFLNNIGPGLGIAGPVANYAAFSPMSKLVLCAVMLLGRLEIYPMLFLFAPAVWRMRSLRSW